MTAMTDAIVTALQEHGITAEPGGTGGGCMALFVSVEDPDANGYPVEILATDGDASLPDGVGGYVGLYVRDADPLDLLATDGPVTVDDYVTAIRGALDAWQTRDEPFAGETVHAVSPVRDDRGVFGPLCGAPSDISWTVGGDGVTCADCMRTDDTDATPRAPRRFVLVVDVNADALDATDATISETVDAFAARLTDIYPAGDEVHARVAAGWELTDVYGAFVGALQVGVEGLDDPENRHFVGMTDAEHDDVRIALEVLSNADRA